MADPLMELDSIQGLSSLLDDAQEEPNGAKFFVDLDRIEPDPNQPRKTFDEEKLKELDSMECEIEGDNAKCGPKGEDKKLTLVKVDGKWKVDFKKPGRPQ